MFPFTGDEGSGRLREWFAADRSASPQDPRGNQQIVQTRPWKIRGNQTPSAFEAVSDAQVAAAERPLAASRGYRPPMGRRDSPVWSSLRPAGSKRRKGKAMSDEATARKREVRAVFDRVVPDYDAAGPGCFAHFGRRLVEAVGVEPGQRVLDVATGRGAVLVPAAELAGPSGAVVGIDLSEAMVRLTTDEAARRGLNARARVMDAEALDFPDATVNRVLCGFVVMFFPDLPRALAEFRRVLTPTGRLGISTWQVSQASAVARVLVELGMMEASAGPARRSFRDPEALMRPLAAAGFADVRVVTDEATFRYADAAEAGRGPALLPDCRP
jgi:O-methyltransferase/aklanonic acid methyltransferase